MIQLDPAVYELIRSGRAQIFAMASPGAVAAERLRRIAKRLETVDDPDSQWLAEALNEYLRDARRGLTLDQAVGVAPLAFVPAWWEEGAGEERTRLIADLAARVPARSISGQAKAIAAVASRYATTAWPREKDLPTPPAHRAGTPEETCWALHHTDTKWPLGWRQLLVILESLQS